MRRFLDGDDLLRPSPNEDGDFDACEEVLQDGIASDFIPAYFWLARLRFLRSGDRKTCREIRPLLEYARDRGHPGATHLLAALMLLGRFGLRQVPGGFRMVQECMKELEAEDQAEAGAAQTAAAAWEGSKQGSQAA
jgi:hypothetical protein